MTYTRPRIQRKRAESLGFCPRRYTDIIPASGFRSNYYTEIISNYTFRFVRRVWGISHIYLSYNIIPSFPVGPSIYVSLSPLYRSNREIRSEKNKAMRTKRRDRLSPVPLSCSGAKSGTRTHDLFVTNEMLYRLSYFGNVRILAELRVQIWEKFPEFPAKTFIFFRRATYEVHISLIISHINISMQAMTDDPKKQRPKRRQPFLGSERTSPAMPYEKNSPYKGCPSKPSRPRTAFAATRQEGSATARARRS